MKKRRNNKKTTPLIIILTVLILLLVTLGFLYFLFFNSIRIRGTWTREIDLSDYALEEIEDYLNDVPLSGSVNPEDYLDTLPVTLNMTLENNGKLTVSLDETEYNACCSSARDALKAIMAAILSLELAEAEIDTEADMEEMVSDALGISLDEYLDEYGPSLLPSFSELQMTHAVNGFYRCDRTQIFRSYDPSPDFSTTPCEAYVVSEDMLVISGLNGNEIYYRKKNP